MIGRVVKTINRAMPQMNIENYKITDNYDSNNRHSMPGWYCVTRDEQN